LLHPLLQATLRFLRSPEGPLLRSEVLCASLLCSSLRAQLLCRSFVLQLVWQPAKGVWASAETATSICLVAVSFCWFRAAFCGESGLLCPILAAWAEHYDIVMFLIFLDERPSA